MPDVPTYRPVYKALHRPLTICGVDRRLFLLSLLLGGAREVGSLRRDQPTNTHDLVHRQDGLRWPGPACRANCSVRMHDGVALLVMHR